MNELMIQHFAGLTVLAMVGGGILASALSRPGWRRRRAVGVVMGLALLGGTAALVLASLSVAPAG